VSASESRRRLGQTDAWPSLRPLSAGKCAPNEDVHVHVRVHVRPFPDHRTERESSPQTVSVCTPVKRPARPRPTRAAPPPLTSIVRGKQTGAIPASVLLDFTESEPPRDTPLLHHTTLH